MVYQKIKVVKKNLIDLIYESFNFGFSCEDKKQISTVFKSLVLKKQEHVG